MEIESRLTVIISLGGLMTLLSGAPAATQSFADDFAAGLNTSAWQVVSNTAGYAVDTSQGDVRFSRPAGGDNGFQYVGLELKPRLRGDFDVSVDFHDASIKRVDGQPGNQVQLNVFMGGQTFVISRSDEASFPSGQNVHLWLDPPGVWAGAVAMTSTAGRLRVTRAGTHARAYFNSLLLYEADYNTTDTAIQFTLQNNGTRDATAVTFDNFSVAADHILWPVPFFDETFAGPGLDPALVDPAGVYQIGSDGAWTTGPRNYLRTVASDYNTRDFQAEVSYTMNGGGWMAALFFGLGSGDPDPTYSNEPLHSIYALDCAQDACQGTWVISHSSMDDRRELFGWNQPGTLLDGTNALRLIKQGDRLTVQMDYHYDPQIGFVPTYSGDLNLSNAPFLDASNSRLFVGTGPGPNPTRIREFRVQALSGAPTNQVTSLADSGPGTLRAAIAAAVPGGVVTFAPGLTGSILLTSSELLINTNLTIIGPGAKAISVSGNHSHRVFNVAAGTVRITDLTITSGASVGYGGGLFNSGNLTLERCVLAQNAVTGDSSVGGAIYNIGNLNLSGCTLSGNSASRGGAIDTTGVLALNDCTLAYNTAQYDGGALVLEPVAGCGASLTNCTLAYNLAQLAGGIHNAAGALSLQNCIVARNMLSSTIGTFAEVVPGCTSFGHNLIGNTNGTTGWVGSDLAGSDAGPLDPLLGPLQDNGGPTPTMGLGPGSPAIDAGISGGTVTDQRGHVRPQDDPTVPNATGSDGSDIGAYERDVTVNYWVSANSGKWETASNWWAGPPSWAQSPLLINNAGSKTVTIDNVTAGLPAVMNIDDLSISAPGGSSNTVNVSNSGGALPLNIASNLVIQSGGALALKGGSLAAGNLVMTNAGGLLAFNSGTLTLYSSTVSNGTGLVVGDGVNPAVLSLPTGTHSFPSGLTIAANATLEIGCATVTGPMTNLGRIVYSCSNALGSVANIVNFGILVADGTLLNLYGSMINLGTNATVNGGDLRFYGPVVGDGSFVFGQPAALAWFAFDPLARRSDGNTTITVEVHFDKPLAPTFIDPTNWVFKPGLLASCSPGTNGLTVLLSIANAPPPGAPYSLSFTNLTDIAGNAVASQLLQGTVPFYAIDYALSGAASQSSTAPGTSPYLAIDGNTDGKFPNNSVTLNAYPETNGWWEVDLGAAVPIQQVHLWFRTEYGNGLLGVPGPARDDNFTLMILDANRTLLWTNTYPGTPPTDVAYTYAAPLAARYVRFESQSPLTTSDGYFSLAEVEVLAPFTNYALTVWQDLPATVYADTNGLAFLGPLLISASNAPDSALQYQWQGTFGTSNPWTDIPGATSNVYAASLLSSNNVPQYYRCRVSLLNSNLYSHAALALPMLPPQVGTFTHRSADSNLWTVTAYFNEPVGTNSAANPANYSFNCGTLVGAVASADQRSAVLTVANLGDSQGNYILTIANVTDQNGYGAGLATAYTNNVSGGPVIARAPALRLAPNPQEGTNLVLAWPKWASLRTSGSLLGPWRNLTNPPAQLDTNQNYTLNVPMTHEQYYIVAPNPLSVNIRGWFGARGPGFDPFEGAPMSVVYQVVNGAPPLSPPIPEADWGQDSKGTRVGYVVAYLDGIEVGRQALPYFYGPTYGAITFVAPYAGHTGVHELQLMFAVGRPELDWPARAYSEPRGLAIGARVVVGLEYTKIHTTRSRWEDDDYAYIHQKNAPGQKGETPGPAESNRKVYIGNRGGTLNYPVYPYDPYPQGHPIDLYLGPFDIPASYLQDSTPLLFVDYGIVNNSGSSGVDDTLNLIGKGLEIASEFLDEVPVLGQVVEYIGKFLQFLSIFFRSCDGEVLASGNTYAGLDFGGVGDGTKGLFLQNTRHQKRDSPGFPCDSDGSDYEVFSSVHRNVKLYRVTVHTVFSSYMINSWGGYGETSSCTGYPSDHIYVTLFGTRNQAFTPPRLVAIPLRAGHDNRLMRPDYVTGPDVFVFPYPDVGTVDRVQIDAIHRDCSCCAHDAWWILGSIEVEDLVDGGHWTFYSGQQSNCKLPFRIELGNGQWGHATFWPCP